MSMISIPASVVGLEGACVVDTQVRPDHVVIEVRPYKKFLHRCPVCQAKCPVYDTMRAPRRWRCLDLCATKTYVQCSLSRVRCPEHGVLVEGVPWARHASRFTRDFELMVAWTATGMSRSMASQLMRVDWKSVGDICTRVRLSLERGMPDRMEGLRRIGVDETSYRKGQKYLTVVIDHDSGRVVWCAKGYGKSVLERFFQELGAERCAGIQVVTADGAAWIRDTVERYCPHAQRVMDPFHVMQWMSETLDKIRQESWKEERREARSQPKRKPGRPRKGEVAGTSKTVYKATQNARWAVLTGKENLNDRQQDTLKRIEKERAVLYRAWMRKEALRDVLRSQDGQEARERLDRWLAGACRSRHPLIKALSKKVRRHKDAIVRAVELGISNARVEAINNKIKLTIRMGYGFRNIDNLISLIMLKCSNLTIPLPGRQP